MYICSKPVFFVSPNLFLSHSSKFGYPFGLNFGQYITIIWKLLFNHKKYKRSELQALAGRAYPGHITEEGGTRRHPGGTQEAPRRHPEGTQEAPRGTQGTQEPPRGLGSKKVNTSQLKCKKMKKTTISRGVFEGRCHQVPRLATKSIRHPPSPKGSTAKGSLSKPPEPLR